MQAAHSLTGEPETLAGFYSRVRSFTEQLCKPLEIEDYVPQPVVDVSPPKWNIAHTTWFFEEMVLKQFVPDYKVFDEDFGFLFNSYYNTVGERTPRDHRALSRPTVKQVFDYRKYVDEKMLEFLSEPGAVATGFLAANNRRPVATAPGSDLVILGLNHEQQHQELFITDLKYTFGLNPLFPAYREGYSPEETAESGSASFIEMKEGVYDIGHAGDSFCFDNELSRHKVYLQNYEIASKLVTNFDFLEFVNDGGYRDHRLWHSEGLDWVKQNGVDAPLHWHNRGNEWHQFTLGGLRKLDFDAPVCHISYYEAAAFAEWREMRLPTEFEWEAAAAQSMSGRSLDPARPHPLPAIGGSGLRQTHGETWQWTRSSYDPYPGFRPLGGALGEYNGKFMVGPVILRGGSCATPEGHLRPTYRNFFPPSARWQFSGIRLAEDL